MNYLFKKITDQETLEVTYEFKNKLKEKFKPRGEFVIVQGEDYEHFSLVVEDGNLRIEENATAKGQADIEAQIKVKYDEMVTAIYSEMLNVFGTSNDASATAFAATWEAMAKRPANYVSAELGLVDEAAVTAYANQKITDADAYGVFRMKRILQFETEKNTILGV